MCTILLSIHPEFVNKIMNGEKKFEFRKVRAKKNPEKIIIYSTSPVCKIIGEAEVEEVLIDDPETIWNETKQFSGVNKKFYVEYFNNKDIAIAYKLKNVIEYPEPVDLECFGLKVAPQSFIYV